MGPLDTGIVLVYLAATLALSALLARRQHDDADYYVGARRLPWWALALSVLATQSSANSFLGIPAYVALVPGGGLNWLQYELALPLAMLGVLLLLAPALRALGLISVYEYLELRFDRRTRLVLAAVFLLSRALATGVALYAAALVVQAVTGLPLPWAIVALGGITVVYDTLGGMRAVVWTDVLQMAVLAAGLGLCLVLAWQQAGGVQAVLASHLSAEPARLQVLGPGLGLGDGAAAPMWGFFFGGLVLYASYYGVDQSQAQRTLAAASVADAQRVLLANGLLRLPLTLAYMALGLGLGAVLLQDAGLRQAMASQRPDALVPTFMASHLPAGLRGLLAAALLAAAMSSLDSALNSLSAVTLRDFVAPHLAPKHHLRAGRAVTVAWGVAITGFAFATEGLGRTVVETINRVGSLFYGPLLAAFLCGLLFRRVRGGQVLAGVAVGLAANLALAYGLGPQWFWMWWNLSGLVVAAFTTLALALAWPGPAPLAAAGTVPGWTGLRAQWRQQRGTAAALSLATVLLFAAATAAPALLQRLALPTSATPGA